MPTLSEPEVIAKAVSGDSDAFRLLVEKHQAFVISLSYRFVGNRNDAQDIAQETFLRLWKNLARYRAEVKLTTWLYKIVTNLCLDFLKSKHGRQVRNKDALHHDFAIADPTGADQGLMNEELRVAILKLTEELTPKQKAVLVLRDLEELPVQEVSDILSMSPGNVKSNLYYARIKMSELIRQYYQEPKT